MRTRILKRTLWLGVVVGCVGATLLTAAPAGADPHPAHPGVVISATGSDTTENFMDLILTGADEYNVKAEPVPGITVPGDAHCVGAATYAKTPGAGEFLAPKGSGNGRIAFKGALAGTFPDVAHNTPLASGTGCVDIARSSSNPGNTGGVPDPVNFEFYGFGLSAMTWASPSLNAPASMTITDLRNVYNCTIRRWEDIPGNRAGSGPIQRFMPQPGSGTHDTFRDKTLGFDPNTISFPADPIPCPAVIYNEENHGNELLLPANRALYQNAIIGYDAGKWVAQANNAANPTLDIRSGVRPGGLDQQAAAPKQVNSVRWTGTQFQLNDATIVNGRTVNDATTTGTFGTPSFDVTSVAAAFVAGDVGSTLSGTNIPAGSVIQSVSGNTATINRSITSSATNGSLTIGIAVISEKNPNNFINSDASIWPGVRILWNIIDADSPDYAVAQSIVAFVDAPGGAKSPLCSGADTSLISSQGFLPLPARVTANGNIGVTCRAA